MRRINQEMFSLLKKNFGRKKIRKYTAPEIKILGEKKSAPISVLFVDYTVY